jgi:hypothetical protein
MSNRHLNNTTKLVHNITKYQNLVDQLKQLNVKDLVDHYNQDNHNMKLLIDGLQWQVNQFKGVTNNE